MFACDCVTMPTVYLTRIEQFSAAHRLNCGKLSREDNQRLFGKCNNVHGHNYKLEVTIKGPINQDGMVINIEQMKRVIDERVLKLMDHKHIDEDVEYFKNNGVSSTAENIAQFIWLQLCNQWPDDVTLSRIKLHETDKNIVEICD